MSLLLIQIIGGIGYTLLGISYYRKKSIQILFLQIIANIFFTIHYYLLGGITGSLSNIIGLFACIMLYIFDKRNLKVVKNIAVLIAILILLALTIVSWERPVSVLPFIAFTFTTISFLTKNESIIRKVGIFAAVCWLAYAIVYDSYVAIAFELIVLVTTTASLIYEKKLKEKEEKNKPES